MLNDTDKASLRQQVFVQIREGILEGTYQIGEPIRENTVATQLGVSRTPVREAMRQLELEGLVQSIPNKETIVTGITEQDVEDIFMIRSRLEGMATRMAADRITAEELAALEEILALTAFYVGKEDVNGLKQLDHKFHDIIYKATKSKTLTHILSDFHHYIQKARKKSIGLPGRAKEVLKEHQAIYEALVAKDGDAAEALALKHVQRAASNIREE